jgi:SAM-dependent methyltransferase
MIGARQAQTAMRISQYEDLADEYYDRLRHPTCWNMRELSALAVVPALCHGLPATGTLVEVGAGLSMLAPEADEQGFLDRVVLVDSSPTMLSHSKRWIGRGAHGLVAPAEGTGLPDRSAALIVSSLGDPYNDAAFWREVARLLAPGGQCLFTTPSFEWASAFRRPESTGAAEFLTRAGMRMNMPSRVFDRADQIRLIETARLEVASIQGFGTGHLRGEVAPKLLCVPPTTPIIWAYSVRAPR